MRGDQPGEMGFTLQAVQLGSGLVPLQVVAGAEHTCVLCAPANTSAVPPAQRRLVKCFGCVRSRLCGINTCACVWGGGVRALTPSYVPAGVRPSKDPSSDPHCLAPV